MVDYNQMLKVLLLLGVQLVAVLSWWDVGHMLTAAIAEIRINQLDPFSSIHFRELVTSINSLCDNRTRTFIESACWPDDLKGKQYNMNLFDPWHFKDRYLLLNSAHTLLILSCLFSTTLKALLAPLKLWQRPPRSSK